MAVKPKGLSLWVGVGIGFAAMTAAWVVLFIVAKNNPVQEIRIEQRAR
ncbi:MAG: hypothetical protein SFV32_09850 [Opitutaceae bacterium]|nr:hypothetical protein [Opitutaceae bacterium]